MGLIEVAPPNVWSALGAAEVAPGGAHPLRLVMGATLVEGVGIDVLIQQFIGG